MDMPYFIFQVSRTKNSTSYANKCIVGILSTRVPPLAGLPNQAPQPICLYTILSPRQPPAVLIAAHSCTM